MQRILIGAVCLAFSLSALAAGLRLFPGPAPLGPGPVYVPVDPEGAGEGTPPDDQLERDLRALDRRSFAKIEVARDAIAGRLTLFEAAARFRAVDADAPDRLRRGWRVGLKGGSDEERYCRQVLCYVETLTWGGDGDPAVVARLRAQVDEALARGDLRLPGP